MPGCSATGQFQDAQMSALGTIEMHRGVPRDKILDVPGGIKHDLLFYPLCELSGFFFQLFLKPVRVCMGSP